MEDNPSLSGEEIQNAVTKKLEDYKNSSDLTL
jgi:hypothetical protein